MRVQLDRQIRKSGFERLDKVLRGKGLEQTRHILDADRIDAHVDKLSCIVDVIVGRVNGTRRVGHGDLHVSAFLVGGFDRRFKVARVVQRVEDTNDVDAVCKRFLNEILHDVVGIVAIAQNVLSAEKHLQLGVLDFFSDLAQAFPRILV